MIKYLLRISLKLMPAICFFTACRQINKQPLFEVLDAAKTNLHFSNKLTPKQNFNMFHYMYFYNGAGVGAGDFNNDGLTDVFFASNQGRNSLFLNEGKLKFKDVTAAAKIPNDGGWSTGVSIVDINNDGLLDMYVCRVGDYEILKGKNQLLICDGIKNGVPIYTDKAAAYGLDFKGFSTQAAFFDYDMDGDLDMFLLNHSVHQNGTFGERSKFLGTYHPLSGDKLYRNDGNIFTDVTKPSNINSSAISYGLGIAVSDINLDGYPDLYIGNDFHENDYLYINQKNGTFKDESQNALMHTSQYSMGVDVADVDNDAQPEIITMDMLPEDPYILKRSLGEDEYTTFNMKIKYGYNHQYTRNNLQWNRGNGQFSEIALYAGVFATDWSWGALWMDMDNDGKKDLFISNGIPKRLNDIDYVNYVTNDILQQKIKENKVDDNDMALVNKFPQIKLPNKVYRNSGNMKFDDMQTLVANDKPTFSNGCAYADFDNDGDLDIVVNNIDDEAMLYKNSTNDDDSAKYIQLKLYGPVNNINAIGARLIIYAGNEIRTYEKYPVRGFQSSMEISLLAGLKNTKVDSMLLQWPDNTYEPVKYNSTQKHISLTYKTGLPKLNMAGLAKKTTQQINSFEDVSATANFKYLHNENPFNEFDREPLIPQMVSREGPAMAVGDINKDGLDDIFIGASKTYKPVVLLQQLNGKFIPLTQPVLDNDSTYEDVDACFTDVNNDGNTDLIVASGGNEYYGKDAFMLSRVYINDGKGNFTKLENAFDGLYVTASCIAPYDFDGDGFVDLFMGVRAVPWEYGLLPENYFLKNDGKGHFKNVTKTITGSENINALVTNAVWFDVDKDGDSDLLICCEWDGIIAYINNKGSFTKRLLTDKKGWWNFILPFDADGDGDVDLIAGNLGLNSRLTASARQPVKLYYNDFDGNDKKEQLLTYYLHGKEIAFANKDELQKQIPVLKKNFLYAGDFAKASLDEIFSKEKLQTATTLTADYFSNALLMNDGKLNFTVNTLPWQAQLSPFKTAVIVNANNDALPDVLLMGNFYDNNIQMGRYDADEGTVLVNKGKGHFVAEQMKGLAIKGQVKNIKAIKVAGRPSFIIAKNNDSALLISNMRRQ
jgi:enediyne biosynthesis protein E4